MMTSTFKDLPIGTDFEFVHSDLPAGYSGFARGPWRKVSARKYAIRIGNETAKYHHTVGSVNVAVQRVNEE